MLNAIHAFVLTVYSLFLKMERLLCLGWMKVTGLGRRSFICVLGGVALLPNLLQTAITGKHISSTLIGVALITYFVITYLHWLRSPESGLDTVKMAEIGDFYLNLKAVIFFYIMTLLDVICVALMSVLIFYDPIAFGMGIAMLFLRHIFYAARTNSGPPKPNNTVWAAAKSKVKSLIEANRRPVLIPIRLGS